MKTTIDNLESGERRTHEPQTACLVPVHAASLGAGVIALPAQDDPAQRTVSPGRRSCRTRCGPNRSVSSSSRLARNGGNLCNRDWYDPIGSALPGWGGSWRPNVAVWWGRRGGPDEP